MRRFLIFFLTIGMLLTSSQFLFDHASAENIVYKRCADLNKTYPGGVARSNAVKNKGGKTKYKPFISAPLYDANKRLDRDKDFIACER
ncbi:hypothetical protein HNR63_000227 [Anoxybacillus kamchatkensis]|nr:excalibur calcium-binding domain-containing protein [Anoxybacillus ayderensis]MBA2877200.1 hypothetical protein [Anoxybacillus ayderensis]